jgi:hypothetical protein
MSGAQWLYDAAERYFEILGSLGEFLQLCSLRDIELWAHCLDERNCIPASDIESPFRDARVVEIQEGCVQLVVEGSSQEWFVVLDDAGSICLRGAGSGERLYLTFFSYEEGVGEITKTRFDEFQEMFRREQERSRRRCEGDEEGDEEAEAEDAQIYPRFRDRCCEGDEED